MKLRGNMGYRVYQVNKKTGVTYVYEAISFWDKSKKQARNRQVCIGKLDSETGNFIPSKRSALQQATSDSLVMTASAKIVGPTIILDEICKKLEIKKILNLCFPGYSTQILTMAYYIVANGGALSHCDLWCKGNENPFNKPLSSQRISEILCSITTDGKQSFLRKWMNKILEKDQLCYDITSISSYSEINEFIKYGYNRDKEKLPQMNLAMLFGQNSCLPVYYHKMPGNITDVVTVTNLLKTFKALEIKSLNFVMDKGFYNKKNIDELLDSKSKFTIAVPINNKWVKNVIDDIYMRIHSPEGYHKLDDEILYISSRLYSWGKNNRRCYLHLFYNAHRRAIAIDKFNENLLRYKEELESDSLIRDHQKHYDNFFILKKTPKKGLKVSYNEEAITHYISRYSGFQAILSNAIKDPVKTMQIYRDKDAVEKSFDDLKNQLDMKRLRMHSSKAVDGRLFVQFIALIFMSALRKEMRKTDLIEKYTVRELLKEMKTLIKIKYSGKHGHILTEISKQQRDILEKLKISLKNKT